MQSTRVKSTTGHRHKCPPVYSHSPPPPLAGPATRHMSTAIHTVGTKPTCHPQLTPTFFEAGRHALGRGLGVVVPIEILVALLPRERYRVQVNTAGRDAETDGAKYLPSQATSEQATKLRGRHGEAGRGKRKRRGEGEGYDRVVMVRRERKRQYLSAAQNQQQVKSSDSHVTLVAIVIICITVLAT